MPSDNIYRLDSAVTSDWAVFKIKNQDPATLVTLVKGRRQAPLVVLENEEIVWEDYKNKCGTHIFYPKISTLYWI